MSTPTGGDRTAGPGPSPEARLLAEAEQVREDLRAQTQLWDRGFTRRRLLAGAGMVAVAAVGSQLVTTRHAFAAAGTDNGKTLITVFLRGGMDGLATVVPRNDPAYIAARAEIAVPTSVLKDLDSTFGLHPVCAPLYPLWQSGKLAFVPAAGSPNADRDHFAAQALMERGEAPSSSPTGWLDRVLEKAGPGTTFRAVSEGPTVAASLHGMDSAVAMTGIDSLKFANPATNIADAMRQLYTGLDNPLEDLVNTTVNAVSAAGPIQATSATPHPDAHYSPDDFGAAMADIARLLKADAGLRVATVDFGGWDLHTDAGVFDLGDQNLLLAAYAQTMSAFAIDIGTRINDVTVVTMSEFGRRLEMNSSGGTDHGHGGLMTLMGGMVNGGKVHGSWPGLRTLDLGDVLVSNDYRDVLGEAAQKTLGIGDMSGVFPGHPITPLGVMR